ncbi:hypothetical protein ACH47Z_04920 [Streptomyces sp. NPDC020192]|uniref:hypothetical protein n=1 Tax=Streptomyces sp. NPDC020192 TaxID=3365066 RepID=UPI003794890A
MGNAGTRRHGGRAGAALAVCGVLLAGCSGSDGGSGGSGTANPSASGSVSARASDGGTAETTPRFTADPAKLPRTRSAALELLRAVTAGPDSYGPGYTKRSPFESDPADWPVLGTDCVWQQQALPGDVLASLTRYSRLPAGGGKGEVHTAATVTVHRTAAQADQEIAETLEEALRCPDQQLRATERISGLNSVGAGYGSNGNVSADDYLQEVGSYLNPALDKGPLFYLWDQVRLGPVTIAVAVQGGKGFQQADLLTVQARAVADMETGVRNQLGAPK